MKRKTKKMLLNYTWMPWNYISKSQKVKNNYFNLLYFPFITIEKKKINNKAIEDKKTKEGINLKAEKILQRMEELKDVSKKGSIRLPNPEVVFFHFFLFILKLKFNLCLFFFSKNQSQIGEKLTQSELEILKQTSYVNGRLYLPWLSIDLQERFLFYFILFLFDLKS